ncbi:MAG: hypothetical protein K0U93_27095 [Gammaproteobacteria bacterium]|nr:hypothetical protein [Gammaproteobacteria bacterium]
MARDIIFNPRRLRLLRPGVPVRENAASLLVLCALVALVVWVVGRKDAFDPAMRDLPVEMLLGEREQIHLYTLPLKRWQDPATARASIGTAAPDLKLFPASVVDATWVPEGRVREFSSETLFEKINGEAPKFLKQGFRTLQYLVLKSLTDETEIAMELFDQRDVGGSLGVFSAHVTGARPVKTDGDVTYFLTSAGVIGRVGRYFFRVAADRESEMVEQKTQQLVAAFAGLGSSVNETASEAPLQMRLLADGFELDSAQISFQAKNVFQFDFAEGFWFGTLDAGAPARAFVHRAPGAEQARALFAQLVEEQSFDFETVSASDDNVVLRHQFLKSLFGLSVMGQFLVGVENAKTQAQVATVMARWPEVLSQLVPSAEYASHTPEGGAKQ